ncbi:YraN family protein [Rhodococcoides corynebacterioides]|uniref:UPF0102 protein HQ603_11340 n=1 Tax=Rhodococcoides corynebacterioides TaxID=53972 RepID=A0ABS7P4K3_9NOCA|nr:YraN family protein [Rhodococcus corynebacterioides]MBY6367350.1 YraN family protein [Rhodococcus corynebacterioides]MBY6409630.1 YraN family protein [Rhodococcus corynebacterioides]
MGRDTSTAGRDRRSQQGAARSAAQDVGRLGEDAAATFLTAVGLDVVTRNWRSRHGEIDIVAADGDTVVFVEVKTRSGTAFGTPAEAVTPAKAARLHRLAGLWLAERAGPWVPVRFDIVEVIVTDGADPRITHLPGAF